MRAFFLRACGITTGPACGTQIANLTLTGMDALIKASVAMHIFAFMHSVNDIYIYIYIYIVHDIAVDIDWLVLSTIGMFISISHMTSRTPMAKSPF